MSFNEEMLRIAKKIKCLTCQGQTVDGSFSPMAEDIRQFIYAQLKNGKNESEILQELEGTYGTAIRLNPPYETTLSIGISALLVCVLIASIYIIIRKR